MFTRFILCLMLVGSYSCSGGYSPPSKLVEPDATACFDEALIKADKGGRLLLDMKECGSLRYSEAVFEENSISQDATFKLSVGAEIIDLPSFKLNYTIKLEFVSPQGVEITGSVYSIVPFVSTLLSERGYATIDVSTFYRNEEEASYPLAQFLNEKDDELKKIKTLLTAEGEVQPGVSVNGAMQIGQRRIIDFNNSQGSYIFAAEGGQKFVIMLTPLPFTDLLGEVGFSSSTSSYTVEASQAAISSSRIYGDPVKRTTKAAALPAQTMDEFLMEKMRSKLDSRFNGSPLMFKTTKKIDFAGGIVEGQRATGISIWDYSDCYPSFLPGCDELATNQEAVVHKVTDNGIFLVHDRSGSYDSLSPEQIDAVDDLADAFEASIYPRDSEFFGAPSDVDGNGKVIVLITDTLENTGILGFFYSADLFTNDGVAHGLGGFGDSNEAEILYVTVPSSSVHKLLLQSIVAHELQHLINFNNKTLKKYLTSTGMPLDAADLPLNAPFEDVFLNEGLSHLAEDICGLADVEAGIAHILNHPNENYFPFLKNNWRSSLTDSRAGGSFAMRGHNYLLMRYLFEQAGGASALEGSSDYDDDGGIAFLKQLVSSDDTGLANINNTFYENDPLQRSFSEAYMDWMVALYNDKYGEVISSDPRFNYDPEYKDEINSNQTVGIDLGTTRTLEDTGENVELDGPFVFSFADGQTYFSSSIANMAAAFIEYRLNTSPSDGNLRFAIRGESSVSLKGLIFRVE